MTDCRTPLLYNIYISKISVISSMYNKYIIVYYLNCFKHIHNLIRLSPVIRPRDLIQDGRWIFSFIILTFVYLAYCPVFLPPTKSQIITKLDFFTLPQKVQKLVLINNSKAFRESILEYINPVLWSCFMIVYQYDRG